MMPRDPMTSAEQAEVEADERFYEEREDTGCKHGTAWDVHCCGCHSGFLFNADHVCPEDDEDREDREAGDDDGAEYADPRDEQEARRNG